MSDAASWWASKVGAPQMPPRGLVLPPAQPVQQVAQPQYQQVPQPQYVQPQAPQPQPIEIGKMSYQQVAREHDGEKISHMWQGGQGMRTEGHKSCPGCGSMTGYTEFSGTMMNGTTPRPHCYECGYNGAFMQGLQANWA